MRGWPRSDANLILIFEILLMSAFLMMDAADLVLQEKDPEHYAQVGYFPVSQFLTTYISSFSVPFENSYSVSSNTSCP